MLLTQIMSLNGNELFFLEILSELQKTKCSQFACFKTDEIQISHHLLSSVFRLLFLGIWQFAIVMKMLKLGSEPRNCNRIYCNCFYGNNSDQDKKIYFDSTRSWGNIKFFLSLSALFCLLAHFWDKKLICLPDRTVF